MRKFNVREDLFNTWAKSSENEQNQSLDERTGMISKKSTLREDLLSETGNTFIVESDPSFARESESERYTTMKSQNKSNSFRNSTFNHDDDSIEEASGFAKLRDNFKQIKLMAEDF